MSEEVHLRGFPAVPDTPQRELQELTGKHQPLPPPIKVITPPAAHGPVEVVKTLPKSSRVGRVLQTARDEERAAAKLSPVVDHFIPLPQYAFPHSKSRDIAAAPHPPIDVSPRQPAIAVTPPANNALPVVSVQTPSVSSSEKDSDIGPKRGLPVRLIHILRGLAPWPDTSRPKSPRLENTTHPTVASPPPSVVSPLTASARSAESYLCLDPHYTREGIALRVAALPPKPDKSDRPPPSVSGHVENPTYVDPAVRVADGAAAAHAGQIRSRDGVDEGREGKKTRMADTGTAALDLAAASMTASGVRADPEVYLVDCDWYREWSSKSQSLAAGLMSAGSLAQRIHAYPTMSPLNNNRLVDPPGSDQLKRGLKEGHEFVVVSESLWNDFHERYHAGPPLRRVRIPTHSGPAKTVLYPMFLNVPSMQHGSPITFDETFSLKELKYYLCTKLSQPPYRCRLLLRRASMTATEICSDDDHRSVFESNIKSGDYVGVQREGVPDRIEIGPPTMSGVSYPVSSAQMGVTSLQMDDDIRGQMNVRDNYYPSNYDPAYPSSSRHAGDIIRPVIGASRGPSATSGGYFQEFDDAELAAAIAASLQDAPGTLGGPSGPATGTGTGASTHTTQVPTAPVAPTTQGMPPLMPPQHTEHRPLMDRTTASSGHWLESDDDDLTEDEREHH